MNFKKFSLHLYLFIIILSSHYLTFQVTGKLTPNPPNIVPNKPPPRTMYTIQEKKSRCIVLQIISQIITFVVVVLIAHNEADLISARLPKSFYQLTKMLISSIYSFNDIGIFVILQTLKFQLKLSFSLEYKRENAISTRFEVFHTNYLQYVQKQLLVSGQASHKTLIILLDRKSLMTCWTSNSRKGLVFRKVCKCFWISNCVCMLR